MQLNLLSKIFTIVLLMVFLFSCGTSSNGVFEKRKHLKGWHFQKKSSVTMSSTHELSKDKPNESNLIEETDLSIRQGKSVAQSKTTKLRAAKKEEVNIDENVSQFISDSIDQSNLSHSAENVVTPKNEESLKLKDEGGMIASFNKDNTIQKMFSKEFHQNNEKSQNVISEDEPVAEDNPRINSPWKLALKILGLVYAVSLAMLLVLFIGLVLVNVNLLIIGIPILVIGIYLGLSFFVYYLLRLLRRTDEKEIWSLKKTFLWMAIIYSVIGAVLYPLIFKEIL